MTASYISKKVETKRRSANSLTKIVFLFFCFIIVMAPLFVAVKPAKVEAFDIDKWFHCNYYGDSELMKAMYNFRMTEEIPFLLKSKSAYGGEIDLVSDSLNKLLEVTGQKSFEETNEEILGRKLYKSTTTGVDDGGETDDAGGETNSNGGTHVTPFDRFGMSGMKYSGYIGEWKYFSVDPCAENPKPLDTQTNLFYENRLVPQATFETRASSVDYRSVLHVELGWNDPIDRAFYVVLANWVFNATKLFVAMTLAFINLSFVDITTIVGLDKILAGNPDTGESGLFNMLFDNIFMSLIVMVVSFSALRLFWISFGKRQVRMAMTDLARTIALFVAAIIISSNPTFWIAIPNNVAIIMQSVIANGVAGNIKGSNEICSLDYGTNDDVELLQNEIDDVTDTENNVGLMEQIGQNARSAIGCSFWQMFLFKPWVEAQFGTDWNNLWAVGKMPDWAKNNGGTELLSGEDNQKMVGDAAVPMGGGEVLNNWALFHLSTQTNAHAPIGKDGEVGQYSNGRNNDWWRIIDVLINYEEEPGKANLNTETGEVTPETPAEPETPTPPADTGIGSTGNGRIAYPIDGVTNYTSPFGMRKHPVTGVYKLHTGVDFGVPCGTPIKAAGSGEVIRAGMVSGYGGYVVIQHNADTTTAYAHMEKSGIKVKVGDKVRAGDVIALVGTTGYSTGCHLHFEVKHKGEWSNPDPWFKGKGGGSTDLTVGGTSTLNNIEVVYGVPKDNPISEHFDTWAGQNAKDRLWASVSSLAFAIVGLSSPFIFAILTTAYGILLSIIIAVAPIFFLIGAWGGQGWNICKQWFGWVVNTVVKRVVTAAMMILSIIVVSNVIKIMQEDGWWKGFILLVVMSLVLIIARKRMIELFSVVKMNAGSLQEKANEGARKVFNSTKNGSSTALNLAAARGQARSFAKKHGVIDDKKAYRAIKRESRRTALEKEMKKLSYSGNSSFMKHMNNTYEQLNDKYDKFCNGCNTLLKNVKGAQFMDEDQNYYCANCETTITDKVLIPIGTMAHDDSYQHDIKTSSQFGKRSNYGIIKDAERIAGLDDEEIASMGLHDDSSKALLKKFVRISADEVRTHFDTNRRELLSAKGKELTPPPIPEFLEPYIDPVQYDEAAEMIKSNEADSNDYMPFRNMYIDALIAYACDNVKVVGKDGETGSRFAGVAEEIGITSFEEFDMVRNAVNTNDPVLKEKHQRYMALKAELLMKMREYEETSTATFIEDRRYSDLADEEDETI